MSDAKRQGSDNIAARMASIPLPSNTPIKSFYDYLPLPSNRHFRVLRLLPRQPEIKFPSPFWLDTETIYCSIKTVSLDEKPEFDALSYTWGNPISTYENEEQAKEGAKIFESPVEIFCDGKSMKVTVNLHDALLVLRRVPRDSGFTVLVERPRAEYLWIDAICINQNDVAERNAQVAIMNQIYYEAKITIVWLGRDDIFTRRATRVFGDIWQISEDTIALMRQQGGTILSARNYASLGLRKIEDFEWLSVYAFLNRNWFRRTWVLQELALSHRICVMSGLLMTNWAPISGSCSVLEQSQWYRSIEEMAERYMGDPSGNPIFNLLDPSILPPEERKPYLYQADKDKIFNPARTVSGMTHVRSGLGIEDRDIKIAEHSKAVDLTGLVQLFRYSSSTDPRDKIYALYGLLPKDAAGFRQNIHRIIPDYNKSVEQVYTEAAWFQLEWTNGLGFLGHVQGSAETRFKNFPSWVPDYGVKLLSNPISEHWVNRTMSNPAGVSPYSAAGCLDFTTPILSQPSSALSLQGVIWDKVAGVGEFDARRDLTTIMHLLAKLPHIYWDDVLRHAKVSLVEKENEDLSVRIEGGYLKGVRSLSEQDERHQNADTGSSSAAQNLISSNSTPRMQTFFEVLWRTLVADYWEFQHPAPLEAGYAFVDCLIQDIQLLFYATALAEGERGKELADKQTEKLTALKLLATSEFEGFTKFQWLDEGRNRGCLELEQDPAVANIPDEALEKMLTRFLPKFDNACDLIFRDLNEPQMALWNIRFAQIMRGRKLFLTKEKLLLGNGLESLEVGDLVCIFAGGSVPYLIRPVDEGRENRFRFVGEAYVHGMMHGEVMQTEGTTVQELILF